MIESFKDQQVYRGSDGCSRFLASKLAELGVKRIFLVTGNVSYRSSGAREFINAALTDQTTCRFSEFEPNPCLEDLKKGLAHFSDFKPDCVIAIGGGSALDMGKLLNFFGSTAMDPSEFLAGATAPDAPVLQPLIAIPTTAGTGSEATHFSVLYKDKIKYSVAHPRMVPSVAILNFLLSEGMTPYQTACTGMDAFAQGIESFWAVHATPESRAFAEKSLRLCLKYLIDAVNHPTSESRAGMVDAAYWAGRAINISKTTACHALSYSLTSHFGLPHGHAVGLLLPHIQTINFAAGFSSKETLDHLFCECLHDDASNFVASLPKAIGLECKLQVSEGDLFHIFKDEVNIERLSNNPSKLSDEDLKGIAHALAI